MSWLWPWISIEVIDTDIQEYLTDAVNIRVLGMWEWNLGLIKVVGTFEYLGQIHVAAKEKDNTDDFAESGIT